MRRLRWRCGVLADARRLCARLERASTCRRSTTGSSATTVLGSLDDWEFKGRIAVKAGDEGFNGKFNWTQDGEAFEATVGGPLGIGTVRIEGEGAAVVLTDKDGETTVLEDAEAELRYRYGWTIPVAACATGRLGIPDPSMPADTEFDDDGRLERLQQSDWIGRNLPLSGRRRPADAAHFVGDESAKLGCAWSSTAGYSSSVDSTGPSPHNCAATRISVSLGRSQVVRHRVLIPCTAGSNPAAPAISTRSGEYRGTRNNGGIFGQRPSATRPGHRSLPAYPACSRPCRPILATAKSTSRSSKIFAAGKPSSCSRHVRRQPKT